MLADSRKFFGVVAQKLISKMVSVVASIETWLFWN